MLRGRWHYGALYCQAPDDVFNKNTSVRAMYRFDGFRVKDWHYDGVVKNAMAAYDSGTLLLDSGFLNYYVNTFGVFLNYRM